MGRSDDALEALGLGIDDPLAGISSAIFENGLSWKRYFDAV
jgi:hypothetical protein